MKKWEIAAADGVIDSADQLLRQLVQNRGFTDDAEREVFLHPPAAQALTVEDVGIDGGALEQAKARILRAVAEKESIVVYADYDADGITAGAVMWEALHRMGATVMPYIPHRVEEGYGLSVKGIDAIRQQYDPSLLITVDHGITAWEKVAYAKSLGIDVIITDHHVKPDKLPETTIVHTTRLAGSGVSWFVAQYVTGVADPELLGLATIGTIADLVPLVGPNRSLVKDGLRVLNRTGRVGLLSLMQDAGVTPGELTPYSISHVLAPRLNAMGRIDHAMDALRLLCTKQADKAMLLARQLGLTNKERQRMTEEASARAKDSVRSVMKQTGLKKLLFVAHGDYNQGVIGLVAGKLVEEFYRPAIVIAQGESISKASARSISGFNIVEAIRSCADILIDVGGHPMAAGFTVETKNLQQLQERLETMAEQLLTDDSLVRMLRIDAEVPLSLISESLYRDFESLAPYGLGNPEPVLVSRGVQLRDVQLLGAEGKHLKLKLRQGDGPVYTALAFGMGNIYPQLYPDMPMDIAYSIDVDRWNGKKRLQLKLKDIHFE